MRLILVGCEYAGKTTLATEIERWIPRTLGGGRTFHDHFTIPWDCFSEEEQEQLSRLTPYLKQMLQRYITDHHLDSGFYSDPDHNLTGFHIEEAVYAPLYYGYKNSPSRPREVETTIMSKAPDTILIHMKATPEVIAKRMRENPHPRPIVREKDIPHVLQRFEEEFAQSFIRRRFTLDTSAVTVAETLAQFETQIEPFLTEADRLRMWTHQRSGASR